MIQNTSSIIKNWPDLIHCGSGQFNRGAIFLLTIVYPKYVEYRYIWHGSHRYMDFNLDGTYKAGAGNDDVTKGCLGQSIQQLYAQDRAFNIVNDYQQVQKLEEENRIQKQKNSLLEKKIEQIQQLTSKFEKQAEKLEVQINEVLKKMYILEQTCESQNPFKFDSSKCLKMFKEKNMEMCIANTNTRAVSAEDLEECNIKQSFCMSVPSWTIIKSEWQSNDLETCIAAFEIKNIIPCEGNDDF